VTTRAQAYGGVPGRSVAARARGDEGPLVGRGAAERIPVTFGALERAGAWQVPERMQVRVLFGSAVLDLREAVLPAGDVEIALK